MSEKSYNEIFSNFEEISNSFNRKNQYFDILYDSFSSIRIEKSPFTEDISVNSKKSGIVARTYTGTWNEIAFDNFSDLKNIKNSLPNVVNKGEEIAEFNGWKFNKEINPKINLNNIPLEEKIEKTRQIQKFLQNYDKRIAIARVLYKETHTTRIFVNNEGCQLRQVIPRVRLWIYPIAKSGVKVEYDYFSEGGEMGFEIFDEVTDDKLVQIADNSIDMLNAKNAPAGRFQLILDPGMAGLIAHESFGHGLEADQVLRGRSYLIDKKNKKVASDICTICDTPSLENQIGSYFFDDEGIKAGKNLLVENGILKNYIYDRTSASVLNGIPQGNGRRESYAHTIHPRMSNTYFEPGDYDLEDMMSEVKEGVMIVKSYFGMEDPLAGGCQCVSKKGYLIRNGEKTQLLKGIALTGYVLKILQNIEAISKDKTDLHGGTCGKGHADLVPVTDGGSYLKIKEALISPG
ncbi:MAG: TldD/PmbA family protein [Candidatus Lokiarchaeota archaeon]|nr:TldD/PmbA family protein [Candidatus Lokiarchaeota archaeon]